MEIDYVFPVNLADDVAELHKFLYDTEDYQVSEQVKEISQAIQEKSKKKRVSRTSAAKTSAADTFPSERTTEAGTEEEWLETPDENIFPKETGTEEEATVGLPTTEGFSPTAPDLFTSPAEENPETVQR